jgi:hypothetical protein
LTGLPGDVFSRVKHGACRPGVTFPPSGRAGALRFRSRSHDDQLDPIRFPGRRGGGGGRGGPPPPPTITSFSPTSGPVGTSVTFTGTDFTGTTAVSFGGVASTNFTVNSSAQIKATVPAGAMTGAITVVTPSGTAVSSANFTVLRSSHDRSLSLMLRKHLIARGTVTVGDGIAACYQRVPVKIQRKLAGDWRTIASTLTGSTGLFREPIPDRAGTYRAVASRVVLANDICRRAVSAVMVNR